MAKATAICTCKTCGAPFEKSTTKPNRADATSWEEWAVKHFDECPACYKKRIQEEENEKGLICRIRFQVSKSKISFWYIGFGDTYSIKDTLKDAGWVFSSAYPDTNIIRTTLASREPTKRWVKEIQLNTLSEEEAQKVVFESNTQAEALGFSIDIDIEPVDLMLAIEQLKEFQKEAAAKKEKELSKPQRPAWMPEGRWNGRIYGKQDKSIFLSGIKKDITDAQAEELLQYKQAMATWREDD